MTPVAPLLWLEDHGGGVMLALLALRWVFSIVTLLARADARGRSLIFDYICLAAYFAGLIHYSAATGPEWIATPIGAAFFTNIALIIVDIALIIYLRHASQFFERRLNPAER